MCYIWNIFRNYSEEKKYNAVRERLQLETIIYFPFSYFVTEAVVLASHADNQLYWHVALWSVSLRWIFMRSIYAMILTNMLIFKFTTVDLIHLNYSFKVIFMLRKDFMPTPRILNRHLFIIYLLSRIIVFFLIK